MFAVTDFPEVDFYVRFEHQFKKKKFVNPRTKTVSENKVPTGTMCVIRYGPKGMCPKDMGVYIVTTTRLHSTDKFSRSIGRLESLNKALGYVVTERNEPLFSREERLLFWAAYEKALAIPSGIKLSLWKSASTQMVNTWPDVLEYE